MPDFIGIRLEGLDATRARLALFPDRLRKNILRGAIRAGAGVFRSGIRSRVPVKSGRLRRDVRISARSFPDGHVQATVSVGTGKGERRAFYSAALEGGAKAHEIAPLNRRALYFNGQFVSVVRRHPGVRARGFVATAARSEYPAAVNAFDLYVRTRINPLIEG